jgi:hypothetical protein
MGDIGFVFIEVLLVTLIIHEILDHRAKKAKMYKLNMIIGVFFSEVGTELIRMISDLNHNVEEMRDNLASCGEWIDRKSSNMYKACINHDYKIKIENESIESLRDFLSGKRGFMVNLLQNPNLLEHDTFSDLLWAVFHMTDELEHRKDINNLGKADREHIVKDMERAYVILIAEWLAYMKHLKDSYPYLFSLAVRTNPFDRQASPEIKDQ